MRKKLISAMLLALLFLAMTVVPALAGPPGPPAVPPIAEFACLAAAFAGQGLARTGQFTVGDDTAKDELLITIANGTTVTVEYTDGDGDNFHCDDVITGTDSIDSITVNAP